MSKSSVKAALEDSEIKEEEELDENENENENENEKEEVKTDKKTGLKIILGLALLFIVLNVPILVDSLDYVVPKYWYVNVCVRCIIFVLVILFLKNYIEKN